MGSRALVLPAMSVAAGAGTAVLVAVAQGCTVLTNDAPWTPTLPESGVTSDAGDAGDAGGDASGNACADCLFEACPGEWAACLSAAECLAISECTGASTCDAACVSACLTAHPNGDNAFFTFATCNDDRACDRCLVACAAGPLCGAPDAGEAGAEAGGDDGGGGGGDGGIDSTACTSCIAGACSSTLAACGLGSACEGYGVCLGGCADSASDLACASACDGAFPGGSAALGALGGCATSSCAAACAF